MNTNTTNTNIEQFKTELKELLEKHNMKLVLSCDDMTAYLSLDTVDSVDNLICEQPEERCSETIVNDYL